MWDALPAEITKQLDRARQRPGSERQLGVDPAAPGGEARSLALPTRDPISPAKARTNWPPLMPMRLWMRQASNGRPASLKARCQA
ncbi:MAG: hypothetical protein NVS1B1_05070 [Candidatus Limnocylindrales bacterium]